MRGRLGTRPSRLSKNHFGTQHVMMTNCRMPLFDAAFPGASSGEASLPRVCDRFAALPQGPSDGSSTACWWLKGYASEECRARKRQWSNLSKARLQGSMPFRVEPNDLIWHPPR
jgi:hypothetical protein